MCPILKVQRYGTESSLSPPYFEKVLSRVCTLLMEGFSLLLPFNSPSLALHQLTNPHSIRIPLLTLLSQQHSSCNLRLLSSPHTSSSNPVLQFLDLTLDRSLPSLPYSPKSLIVPLTFPYPCLIPYPVPKCSRARGIVRKFYFQTYP